MQGKHIRLRLALAVASVCAAALLALTGCGSDALQTTKSSGGESASPSSAQSQIAGNAHPVSEGTQPAEGEVLVTVDTKNAHAYNDKFPETLGTFIVEVEPGQSALDVLKATGLDVGMRGKDYVTAIGGIEEKVCGRDSGWLYLVNGVQPTETSNDYTLNGGETVLWAYTVEQGDVGEKMK